MSKWIWYYGDFEMYHSQKLHLRRTEHDYTFPAFWYIPEKFNNVRFAKDVSLKKEEEICVTANGVGFVEINHKRSKFGKLTLPKGDYTIFVHVSNMDGLPGVFIEGDTVISDESWVADYYNGTWRKVGCNNLYNNKETSPDTFSFLYKEIKPQKTVVCKDGVLYDFGRETFARLLFTTINNNISVYFGETEEEALDTDNSYLHMHISENDLNIQTKAIGFRYIYIPNISKCDVEFKIYYEYLPVQRKASFNCSDETINRIWNIAAYTFELNSREFYLDGIKRDRWVWSGDAYQSYFINRYLYFDQDIAKRTIVALGGKGMVEQHINTIMDYTFYWIMSIYDYYEMTGDKEFIVDIFPRMKAFMNFILSRLDDNGFASKVGGDWIFIDWADIDKTGSVCAEQMLLLRSIEVFVRCAKLIDEEYCNYLYKADELKNKINKYFWNEEKGAYIDSFESGRENITRHANIFALIFGYVNEKQQDSIIKNVILNDEIPQIKTPYFKFYELEAMCSIGKLDYVFDKMSNYWGAMVKIGATSFWEEFNTDLKWSSQLGMYGDKYGKSLCHAWGASPIYLMGRYFLGIKPTSAGYETFEIKPVLDKFNWLEATIPIKNGLINIKKENDRLEISADRDGGTVVYKSEYYTLKQNETLILI